MIAQNRNKRHDNANRNSGGINEKIKKIALSISQVKDPSKYNNYCDGIDSYVKSDLGKVTMTQVRKIYNSIKDIEDPMELVRQRPILMYIGARKKETLGFVKLLDSVVKSINNINDKEKLESFKEFMRVIVAYKTFYDKEGKR